MKADRRQGDPRHAHEASERLDARELELEVARRQPELARRGKDVDLDLGQRRGLEVLTVREKGDPLPRIGDAEGRFHPLRCERFELTIVRARDHDVPVAPPDRDADVAELPFDGGRKDRDPGAGPRGCGLLASSGRRQAQESEYEQQDGKRGARRTEDVHSLVLAHGSPARGWILPRGFSA